jgi:putative endonuclease
VPKARLKRDELYIRPGTRRGAGSTKKYGVKRLVYCQMHDTMDAASQRETRIKKWKRAWKVRLIHAMNR